MSGDISPDLWSAWAKQRDPDAFGKIWEHFWPQIYHCASSINPADALDLAQNAAVRLFRSKNSPNDPQHFLGTVCRTIRNLEIDNWRKGRGKAFVSLDDPDRAKMAVVREDTPHSALCTAVEEESLIALFELLGPKDALVLRLRFIDECSFEKIATLLHINEVQARSRFKAALDRLRPRVIDRVRRGAHL